MSDTFTGAAITQLEDIKTWHPRTGWGIVTPYSGRKAEIETLASVEVLAGNPIYIRPPNGTGPWILEVSYGAEDSQGPETPITDEWELDGNTLEKELWDLPEIRTEFETIIDNPSDDRLRRVVCVNWIKKAIDAFIRGDEKIFDRSWNEQPLTYSYLLTELQNCGVTVDPTFINLIDMFARGIKAFPVSQYVLRRSRIIANNSTLKPIYTTVFKRQTTASLTTRETIPATLKFTLPDGEWVKQTPDVRRAAGTKWQITEEWWHADKWEPKIYGALV